MKVEVRCSKCDSTLNYATVDPDESHPYAILYAIPCRNCQQNVRDHAYDQGYQDGLNGGEWS